MDRVTPDVSTCEEEEGVDVEGPQVGVLLLQLVFVVVHLTHFLVLLTIQAIITSRSSPTS